MISNGFSTGGVALMMRISSLVHSIDLEILFKWIFKIVSDSEIQSEEESE